MFLSIGQSQLKEALSITRAVVYSNRPKGAVCSQIGIDWQIVIPESEVEEIVKWMHEKNGHFLDSSIHMTGCRITFTFPVYNCQSCR